MLSPGNVMVHSEINNTIVTYRYYLYFMLSPGNVMVHSEVNNTIVTYR